MIKSRVAVIKCSSYSLREVKTSLKRGLRLLGGLSQFIKPAEQILLKPNILTGDDPSKAVTVHPSVFEAVASEALAIGSNVVFGDSPGISSPEKASLKAGLRNVADSLGINLADFRNGVEVKPSAPLIAGKLTIARGVMESDGLISISKMKTHGFTRFTGAVKNQFGCIPGLLKGEFHVRMPDINNFSSVLVDINNFIKPRLYIMDGIEAMEGNGPRSGNPVKMGVILISTDPVALDATACRLINLNPEFVPYMEPGRVSGLGTYSEEEIEIVGDSIKDCSKSSFDAVRKPADNMASRRYFPEFLKRFVSPKPVILKDKCRLCGVCVKVCPVKPKAIEVREASKPPVYNYSDCIRCYCCQEMCPHKAIKIEKKLLRRLLNN